MNPLSRRNFLKSSAFAATALTLSARSWGQVANANSDIRVAVVGLNGRGKNHVKSLSEVKGVRIVALCDADSAVLAKAAATLGGGVKTYGDIRELLAASDIDAITVATPNHWHALMGIWACEAGKDVYIEKPVSHNVWEGRQLVAAATKYNRVVQAGTQIRSGDGMAEAVAWVRAGNLGKITTARGFCYKRRPSIGESSGPQPVTPTIDYNLWTGPAALVPPHHNSSRHGTVHYDWHWFWNYGNGDVGNQGIHQMDVARWFLGESGLPRHTLSVGGRLGYVDDGETPNTQVVIHDYATAPLIFEVRGLPAKAEVGAAAPSDDNAGPAGSAPSSSDKYRGVSVGNVIDCEGGYVSINSYFTARAFDRENKLLKEFTGKDTHMQNFIDVVRSRKVADLRGPIGEGHVSSALCHVGNISHLLGDTTPPGELKEKIKGDAALSEAYGRMVEHLALNNVDLAKTPATLGAALTIDPAAERFTGKHSAAANALLTREYRSSFVVPKLV
jgi:predicted dehydrogenase